MAMVALVLLLGTGCMTSGPKVTYGVGTTRYDDLVAQYGKPQKLQTQDSGDFVATWDLPPIEKTGTVYDPTDKQFKQMPPENVVEPLRMTFSRDGVLKSWMRESPHVRTEKRI